MEYGTPTTKDALGANGFFSFAEQASKKKGRGEFQLTRGKKKEKIKGLVRVLSNSDYGTVLGRERDKIFSFGSTSSSFFLNR